MRLPLSLQARMSLMAIAMVCATLLVTAYSIYHSVTWAVSDQFDTAVDAQVQTLREAVAPDGRFAAERIASLPELNRPPTGWGWQVVTPDGHWQQGYSPRDIAFLTPHIHVENGIYSGDAHAVNGIRLHVRRLDVRLASGALQITVVAPHRLIAVPLAGIANSIGAALSVVFLVMVLASTLQVHVGLRPLQLLGRAIARVNGGQAKQLSARQPAELEPVVRQINALLVRNEAMLAGARLDAVNLAHALKTPLATLLLQLELDDASPKSRQLVEAISRQVARHLRRGRSGAAGLGSRARCDAHDAAAGLLPALASLHRDRSIVIENRLPEPFPMAVDFEDLSEMLGNLLDNACRHAFHRVVVSAEAGTAWATIHVDDDGQGVPQDYQAQAMRAGERLDATGEGYGFGLALVREMAELYWGELLLATSLNLGGLRATLKFPRLPSPSL